MTRKEEERRRWVRDLKNRCAMMSVGDGGGYKEVMPEPAMWKVQTEAKFVRERKGKMIAGLWRWRRWPWSSVMFNNGGDSSAGAGWRCCYRWWSELEWWYLSSAIEGRRYCQVLTSNELHNTSLFSLFFFILFFSLLLPGFYRGWVGFFSFFFG